MVADVSFGRFNLVASLLGEPPDLFAKNLTVSRVATATTLPFGQRPLSVCRLPRHVRMVAGSEPLVQ